MIKREEVFKIGKIGRPHGIKGELMFYFTDDVFDRTDADYLVLQIDGILVPFFIEEYRFHGQETALVTFEDIDSQEKARTLVGCEVFFPHSDNDADADELRYDDLEGYTLVDDKTGREVGVIEYVDQQTMNIMFELSDGTLIPASEELITDIDQKNRKITLNIPEGLLLN